MNCAIDKEQLSKLLDNRLSIADKKTLLSHLDECSTCRDEYEVMKTTLAPLRRLAPAQPANDLADKTFRAAMNAEPSKGSFVKFLFPLAVRASVGACLVAMAIGTVALLRPLPASTSQGEELAVEILGLNDQAESYERN